MEPDGPPSFRACHDLSRPGPNGQPAPNESLDFRPLAPLTLASWVDLVQRYRYLRWAYPGQAFRFTLRPHYCRGDMNSYADGASRGLLALPPGPGGAAWARVRPSRAVRYLGTGSGPYLLPPPAPSPGHYAAVQIPRDYVTWADGLTAELLRASPPPWLTSSAGAQPEIPYVPFHPGWTTALRDAQGRPSL